VSFPLFRSAVASFVACALVWVFGGPRAWSLWWACRDEVGARGYYCDIVLLSGWPPAWVARAVRGLSRWFAEPAGSDTVPF